MQNKTKIFRVNYRSDLDDITYAGDFTCKKLSVRDQAQLQVLKSKYNGGMYYDSGNPGVGVDLGTDTFNHMLAHLELALTNKPTWWNLDDISDTQLIAKVFEEVASFEASFRPQRGPNANRGSEAGSAAPDQEAHTGGKPRALVGQEIPSSLEP